MKISLKGLTQIQNRLTKLKVNVKMMAYEILERLIALGYNEARVGFLNAEYDGDNDVEVNIEWDNSECVRLVAQGDSVLFIEFGSGIHYYDGVDLRATTKPQPDFIGTYGKKQGATGKHWFYYGDTPKNPTDSYLGAGDTITYIQSAYDSYEKRTWKVKGGSNSRVYRIHHKERKRTQKIKDGVSATKGNRPARAMWDADNSMQNNLKSVIMEVVRKYVRH